MVKVACRKTSAATPSTTSAPNAEMAEWRAAASVAAPEAIASTKRPAKNGVSTSTIVASSMAPKMPLMRQGCRRQCWPTNVNTLRKAPPRKSMRKRVICLFGRSAPGSKSGNFWVRLSASGRSGAGNVRMATA